MQPKFQYPRRSRYAPICGDDVKEQHWLNSITNMLGCQWCMNGNLPLRSVKIPLRIPFFNGFPFVVQVLAFCQRNLDFDLAIDKIDLQWDQGQPFFVDFTVKLFDFTLVKQQFANPQRIMVFIIGKGVNANMHLIEKYLIVLNLGIRVLDIDLAISHGLDFGAFQDDPSLVLIFDEVIEPGFSVVCNMFFMLSAGLHEYRRMGSGCFIRQRHICSRETTRLFCILSYM